ncbi:MAG: CvpA family protein [Clostridia bacterium]|nr:CvpA family protein [Clostridia bacterium]
MNIIDIIILVVLGVSVLFGMYRGFISGVLSLAGLIGSAALAFIMSGELAAWLKSNETLVQTLLYYTDAGSRITNLDLSLLSVAQVSESALAQILKSANLPSAFESAFISGLQSASGSMTIAQLMSETIVSVSLSILSFLICFLIAYVVVTFVIHLIQYVFELPVLRHLDALIGGAFGLLRGVMLLFIFFALVPIVLAVAPVEMISDLIAASKFAPMFDSQLILSILRQTV